MDDFKNSTKTQYAMGGSSEGKPVKGAAKVAKVMGEFKAGKLHGGPKVMKKANGGAVARGNRVSAEEAGEDKVIDRRRASMREPDYSKMKNYDAPGAKQKPTELSVRLAKRGPAGARYDDTPLLDRVVGAVRNTLGFKKGGLAAMPKDKKC